MPLSWNEIKDRALTFSREWADAESEDADAKSFWDGFFNVYGVDRRRVASFERQVKKLDGKDGYIDLLWKGKLLVEHKSKGKDLDRAYQQATDYFPGLKDHELPRYVLVSDFARFRLYDSEAENPKDYYEFPLKDLPKQVKLFGFLAGYTTHAFKDEDPVNVHAAERMGLLHDELKRNGYEGHALEVLLVRILFCLFADDTGIWPASQFNDLILNRTRDDGTDLGPMLAKVFQTLDTPPIKRQKALDEDLQQLAYVNGRLFEEQLPLADFSSKTRELLLEAAALDWSAISPAIFGALFQSVMDPKLRRNLGAHYTSEKNILKLIGPLFLDDLKTELEKIGHDHNKLKAFHTKLAHLKFLDPACGCGNFLVIAYRELRLLETEVLKRQFAKQRSAFAGVADHVAVNVDQFYGIEIEEFPAQIAQVALWLMDHQMNQLLGEVFEENFARLPLTKSATIAYGPEKGNALRIDWGSVVPKEELSYILGNPPFSGKKEQSAVQKAEMAMLFDSTPGAGVLDFVCAWYLLAARFIKGTEVRVAFVSTNSISQGEQVGVLWGALNQYGVHIRFAHRTFKWSNEAKSNAAVHCVIIGFGSGQTKSARLFDYDTPNGEPHEVRVARINPYLMDAPEVLLLRRSHPLCRVPEIAKGSEATDFGFLFLSPAEKDQLVSAYPKLRSFVRRALGADEFLSGDERWCLWLVDAPPELLKQTPPVLERLDAIRQRRLASDKSRTRTWAHSPSLFSENRQPKASYLAVPKVSSERRKYLPIGWVSGEWIATGSLQVVADAQLYHFGILSSAMHCAWMRCTGGRMKSDYQYSNTIVYNNFPWPESPSQQQKLSIENAAQIVLDARAKHAEANLASLYDPNTMPPALAQAHFLLDRAVDAAYGKTSFKSDAERVAFLFELYQKYTSLLPPAPRKRRRG